MHTTIVDTILDPTCEKHYSISNIDEKIGLCIEMKELEDYIKFQLDKSIKKCLIDTLNCGMNYIQVCQ